MSEKDYDTMLKEVLPWLEHGDKKDIAAELKVTRDYVRRCLSPDGERRSWKVLRVASRVAMSNKADAFRYRNELNQIGT